MRQGCYRRNSFSGFGSVATYKGPANLSDEGAHIVL